MGKINVNKLKIHSQLTYFSICFTSAILLVALFFINKTERQDLPLDGLIAINFFLTSVIAIVIIMVVKLKQVYISENTIIVKSLFLKKEIKIAFDNVIELKNIFPIFLDPFNCRLVYLEQNERKAVYFIKSIKFISTANLGIALGIIKPV